MPSVNDSATVIPPLAYFKHRLENKSGFIPVIFLWCTIIILYMIYVILHCAPLLRNPKTHSSGVAQTTIFHVVTAVMLYCYIKCILVHPGKVPDKKWKYDPQKQPPITDTKRTGEPRHCKWCDKFKPDRSHHCRVCRICILKMDHHCPWIYNCVGFRNHKYFLLMLLYSSIDCHIIIWTMMYTLRATYKPDAPFIIMFLLLFGETFAAVCGFLATLFLFYNSWLMYNGLTIIEWCEKRSKLTGANTLSCYDRGWVGNIQIVLGKNPFFWLFPISLPKGDGLNFLVEESRLTNDRNNAYVDLCEAGKIAGVSNMR